MVGQIVKLKRCCLSNEPGILGVCYEDYFIGHHGSSYIFENGSYDGFDEREHEMFLEKTGFSKELSGYLFTNVMQLSRDFQQGVFNSVLKKGE